jgi:hypothetical protein
MQTPGSSSSGVLHACRSGKRRTRGVEAQAPFRVAVTHAAGLGAACGAELAEDVLDVGSDGLA